MKIKTRLYHNFKQKKNSMMKSFMKVMALTLVFILAIPINPDAAVKKPVFNISGIKSIYVGKTLNINIKYKIADSKYKWSSSNKKIASVNKNGVVKGLKKGTVTITCKITAPKKTYTLSNKVKIIQGVKSIKISNKIKTMAIGNTYKLKTILSPKNIKGKITYSSNEPTIVKVNKNGKITALKVGKAKITVKTASGKKDTVIIEVTDSKSVTVINNDELAKALLDKKTSKISINTNDSVEFVIPTGAYESIELEINAPNADVVNNGTFKNIIITALKSSTWTEKGKENSFSIKAKNTRLIVENSAIVNTIEIVGDNVKLNVNKEGMVENVIVSANNIVISGEGTVKNVIVTENAKSGVEVLTVPTKVTVDIKVGAVKTKNGIIQPGTTITTSKTSSDSSNNGGYGSGESISASKYTVTFNLNFEEAIGVPSSQSVTKDNFATKPTDPLRDGYVFGGWYKERECVNAFDFNGDKITSNTTVYAKWEAPLKYIVSFNLNYEGDASTPSSQSVTKDSFATKPTDPLRDGYVFGGWYKEGECVNAFDFDGDKITSNTTVYAKWNVNPSLTEYSLSDYIYDILGLDNTKDDNDGDGLKDYFEYTYLTTDLLLVDTDGNGISDADEDFDNDGLTNIQEQELGTRPDMVDTDGDGLSDGDEVSVYKTNPLSIDTDDDGLTDDEELKLGLNPCNAISDDITPDNARTFIQTVDDSVLDDALRNSDNWLSPSISGNVSGDILRNVTLEQSVSNAFDDNRSVLSDVIDIYTSYEVPLTLSFTYEQEYSGNIKNLTIVSFGEDGLEVIDSMLDESDKSISAEINSDGTYFVIDLDEFLKGLGIDVFTNIAPEYAESLSATFLDYDIEIDDIQSKESGFDYLSDNEGNIIDQRKKDDMVIKNMFPISTVTSTSELNIGSFATGPSATGKADIVFVIDTTGSMGYAISSVKNNVNAFAERLVSDYNVDANFSLIEFQDITYDGLDSTKQHKNITSNWFTNINAFKNEVNTLSVGDGGDIPETPIDGLELARRLNWRADATKFVVLVTDADYKNDNRYGISNMAEMVNLFVNDGIIVSAITYYESVYQTLIRDTGGLYGYIYGDLSNIFSGFADKVGEITNAGGEWVFLDDFQAVKLSSKLTNVMTYDIDNLQVENIRVASTSIIANDTDTDNDGLSDVQELGSSVELDMTIFINLLLNRHSVPIGSYAGKTKLTVWNYSSNPTLIDTDYDGIPDGNIDYDGSHVDFPDINPRRISSEKDKNTAKDGNAFTGTLNANGFKFDVNFRVDYSLFFNSNKNYKDELAVLGAIYSTLAYHEELNVTGGGSFGGKSEEIFNRFGLKDFENFKLADYCTDDDISEMSLGHREVTYKGVTKDIIIVAVRGTDGTIEEWSSNFDVGSKKSDYWDRDNDYWLNKENHKGFDVAANRLYDKIIRYAESLDSKTSKNVYIVGHSRGAAIANILGAKFEDSTDYQSFTYTFATPMTTTDKGSYNTIFNIVNKDDMVPYLPLATWGFDKYGKTYEVSIKSKYENKFGKAQEGTWEAVFGIDYNHNGKKDDTIRKFGDVAESRDELYKFSDDKKSIYTYDTKYSTKNEAMGAVSAQIEKYGDRISKFCEVYVSENEPLIGKTTYQVSVKQSPAAFMMILTDVIASKYHKWEEGKDEIKNYSMYGAGEDKLPFLGTELGFYVAKKYSAAKASFIWSGADSASDVAAWLRIGGMVHAHMPGSYYFLAYDYKDLIPTK